MYLQSPDPNFRQTMHNLLPEQQALPIYPRILQTFLLHGQEAFPVPDNFLIIV